MTLNMLDLTPRFRPSAFPPSYSMPDAPPSPDMPSSFRRSSSSCSATVFFFAALDDSAFFSELDRGFESGVCAARAVWAWSTSPSFAGMLFDGDDAALVWWKGRTTVTWCANEVDRGVAAILVTRFIAALFKDVDGVLFVRGHL